MIKLTRTQKNALEKLRKAGGSGVMMKNGCVLARGQVLRANEIEDDFAEIDENGEYIESYNNDKFQLSTWLALKNAGKIEIVAGRVNII